MRVSVIGAGYAGLVTGACLAELGHRVVCADHDEAKVRGIEDARPTLFEPGLEALLVRNVGSRLRATTDVREAVLATDVSLLAVGTPLRDGEIDLAFVESASDEIGRALRDKDGYHVVAVKSTVVPGTTDEVVAPTLERASRKRAGLDFGVGVNPEFLTEGQAVDDFMSPDRIVLGGCDPRTLSELDRLYRVFPAVRTLRTTNRTAEMIKYASNALLATMISFANEIGNLCARIEGVDAVDVMDGVHASRYLTPNGSGNAAPIAAFLEAGCGFGGSCLPKDVRALIARGRHAGQPLEVLEAVMRVNERQPDEVIELLKRQLPGLAGARVAVLGLAFKPGTDDTRDSPTFPVLERLRAAGATIVLHDPVAREAVERLADRAGIRACHDLEDAVSAVDAIVVITSWPHFEALPELLDGRDPQPLVVDGRRMLDKRTIARYAGIGLS
jgi:UDPglucose 6-dehydrogenase